jgi:hypothetical protein
MFSSGPEGGVIGAIPCATEMAQGGKVRQANDF